MPATEEKTENETLRLAVRGTPAWVEWLDATAERTERTRSSLLAAALQTFAKVEGLPKPPPRV